MSNVNGSQVRVAQSTLTGNAALTAQTQNVRADATAGAFTVTLPSAALVKPSIPITVTKIDSSANLVTVAAAGADTINGGASLVLSGQYQTIELVSDGISVWNTPNELTVAQVGARLVYGV